MVLLIGAGLLGKSLDKLQHQDLGLETENRVIVDMNPLKAGYKPEQLQGLYQQIEDRFHAMPGVEHVGLTLYTPLNGDNWNWYVFVQGQPAPIRERRCTLFDRASPEYFKAIGQQVIRGRTFTAADTATSPRRGGGERGVREEAFQAGRRPDRAAYWRERYQERRRF